MRYHLIALLILFGSSSTCYAGDSDADWGPWGSGAIKFSGQDKNLTSAKDSDSDKGVAANTQDPEYQAEEKIVYGTGIIGRDENLLHELDQSSLLDYQLTIDINELEFGTFPIDQEMTTQPVESEIENEVDSGLLLDDVME